MTILCLTFLFIACQPAVDNSADKAFEDNSKTVLSLLEGFQSEKIDYATIYSDSLAVQTTGYGDKKDSLNLEEIKAGNKAFWTKFDFKLMNDPLVLLLGVNQDTKKADGSVRYYGTWEVTLTATDSTEAKSAVIKLYASYDFDADGKINNQQSYGDFSGLMNYLNAVDDDLNEETIE